MSDELAIKIPGLTLAAVAEGPEDGTPVLALHGWLDNAASFAPLAPRLVGCRVVALDLAGHGRSEHRADHAGYHFVDWVPDVIAAADGLGWNTFVLLGHSMGAAVATLVAATFPDRVEKAILLDGLAPLASDAEDIPRTLRVSIDQSRRASNKTPKPYSSLEQMAERLHRIVPDLTPATARILVDRGHRVVHGGVTWSYDNRLRRTSSMRFSPAHVEAFLRAVECKTLFVRPRDGIAIPREHIERAVSLIGDLRIHECDGQHHVHMDRPEDIAEVILQFLRAHGTD